MKKRFYRPGRVHFFPALLPFVEIVPWLITLISAVVATASFSLPLFLKKRKKALIGIGLVCCLVGGYTYTKTGESQVEVEVEQSVQLQMGRVVNTKYDVWTRSVEPKNYPVVKIHNPDQASHNAKMSSYQKKWHQKMNSRVLSRLLVHEKTLVYGSYGGSIEALSAFNGRRLWSLPLETYVMALAQDGKGNVYTGEGLHETRETWLTSFNVIDKKVNWQRQFVGHIEGIPVIDNERNKLWVTSGQGGLWALNKDSGEVIMHLLLGHIDNAPLVYKDRVYAQAQKDEGVLETTLYALSESDGGVLWELSLLGQPWGSPKMDKDEGVIYTTTGQGQLGVERSSDMGRAYAISVDGKILWEKELPNMAIQPATYIAEENLFINTTKTGKIVALDTRTGEERWKVEAGDSFMSSAYLITGFGAVKLASVSEDGQFTVRDAASGEEILREKLVSGFASSPVVDDDTIYVPGTYEIVAFGGLNNYWRK